jgi:ABC-type multidrug transport system fused ATPase/permease subunit
MNIASKTGIDEVILNYDKGLNEVIGTFSEKGTNLSGGQWQKVAITRALYHGDARMYILDEPVAALDPISEESLYKNFAEITGDKTTLLISHRLGITSIVDRILVFDQEKIVEDGNHDQLIKRNGIYVKMYKAQAKWYQKKPVLMS